MNRYPISEGQRGINQEMIPRMVEIVRQEHGKVKQAAHNVIRTSGCPVRDHQCHARAIYEWVLERFYWIDDPVLEETLVWPDRFVKEIEEEGQVLCDCASVNMALVALLGSIGIKAVFVFGGDGKREGSEPIVYHVWTGVPLDGEMYYLEPTAYMPAGKARRYPKMIVVDPWTSR